MNKLRFILVSGLAVTLSVFTLSAQSQSDMRLNELLIHNETNFEDDFGFHNGWFELFNTSYGTVNIGGCFLDQTPPAHPLLGGQQPLPRNLPHQLHPGRV